MFSKSANKIEIYLDGKLVQPYTSQAAITFGPGFQIGSVHGNPNATGVTRFSVSDNEIVDGVVPAVYTNSWIGMLRMYDSTLSPEASAKLAEEFPYISPSDAFTRTLDGGTVSWTAEGAWEKGGETTLYSAPTANSVVELTATADTTVTLDSAVTLESLTVKGPGKVTFKTAGGATLAVSGSTTLETNTVLPHTAKVGVVDLGDNVVLTLDYSGYDIKLNAPNGSFAATGLVTGSGSVELIAPTNPKGRTFTLAYNEATGQWNLNYSRPAYTLYWAGSAATGDWAALDVWKKDSVNGEAAAFLDGDSVVFGENAAEEVAVTIPAAVTVGGITFESQTFTAYTLGGTINVTDGAPLTVAGNAAITDLRGTLGAVSLTAAKVTLGTGGELAIATAATVDANTKLTIAGGNGTISYTGGGTAFAGQLEVAQGTLYVDCQFQNVRATEDNHIKVTGTGRLSLFSGSNTYNRLPQGAYVVVDGANAVLEVSGNNPFNNYDARDRSVTVICRNGGTFQVNSANGAYNVHVKAVELDSGNLILAGTVNSWSNRSLEIDAGLTIKGNSTVGYENNINGPDFIVLRDPIQVEEGATLTLNLKVTGPGTAGVGVVKNGAGALVVGDRFYVQDNTITVNEGTLVANAALREHANALTFADGTTLDLSSVTDAYDLTGKTVTLNGKVTLALGDRKVTIGDKLLAWSETAPSGTLRFKVTTVPGDGKIYSVKVKDDGAYLASGGFKLILR